jgi:hypothetical protein
VLLPPDGFHDGAIVVSCGRLNIAIMLGSLLLQSLGRLVNPDHLESSVGDAQDVRVVVSTVTPAPSGGIGSRRRGIRAEGREARGEHLLDFSMSEIFQTGCVSAKTSSNP